MNYFFAYAKKAPRRRAGINSQNPEPAEAGQAEAGQIGWPAGWAAGQCQNS